MSIKHTNEKIITDHVASIEKIITDSIDRIDGSIDSIDGEVTSMKIVLPLILIAITVILNVYGWSTINNEARIIELEAVVAQMEDNK